MRSKIGSLYLVASGKGLEGIFWEKQTAPMAKSLKEAEPEVKILSQTARELEEYFSGKRKKFSLRLAPAGTSFQKSVWSQLRKIPYGKTCSYRDVARGIRNARAVRAVGSANGKNPLPIIVPCHRVIASDGSLGGYSGGLGTKSRLLKLEQTAGRL